MRPLIVFLLLAAIGTAAPAQIIRQPGAASATGDTIFGNPVAEGHRAQAMFEQYRVLHLPTSRVSAPANCDERVGSWCYWYDERPGPTEPKDIADARSRLIGELDTLARQAPEDRWLSAQRVRYLTEADRPADAVAAAMKAGMRLHIVPSDEPVIDLSCRDDIAAVRALLEHREVRL